MQINGKCWKHKGQGGQLKERYPCLLCVQWTENNNTSSLLHSRLLGLIFPQSSYWPHNSRHGMQDFWLHFSRKSIGSEVDIDVWALRRLKIHFCSFMSHQSIKHSIWKCIPQFHDRWLCFIDSKVFLKIFQEHMENIDVFNVFKVVSYTDQGCINLLKGYRKTVIV